MNVLNKPFLNIKTYQYIINELFGKTRKREKKRERERKRERWKSWTLFRSGLCDKGLPSSCSLTIVLHKYHEINFSTNCVWTGFLQQWVFLEMIYNWCYKNFIYTPDSKLPSRSTFTCSKLTIVTLQQGVKYVNGVILVLLL